MRAPRLIDIRMPQGLPSFVRLQSSRGCQVVAGSRRVPGAGRRHPVGQRARVGVGTVPSALGRVVAAAGRRVAAEWASSAAVEPFRDSPSVGQLSPWGTLAVRHSREVVPALQHQRRDQLS